MSSSNRPTRAELLERRESLKVRIKRQEYLDRIKFKTDGLTLRGIEFSVIEEVRSHLSWLQDAFAFERYSIDWYSVDQCEAPASREEKEVERWLHDVGMRHGGLDQPVMVVWMGGDPGLQLRFVDFIAARDILRGLESWVLPLDRRWVVEYAGEWNWGVPN